MEEKGIIIMIAILMAGLLVLGTVFGILFHETEIETYTIEATVTHLDTTRSNGVNHYLVSFVDGDLSGIVDADEEEYAKITEGDLIFIEVSVYENTVGEIITRFELI
jgi:hypothetical protein